jgi:predicted nucleotidyltransferase component of viral defense system
MRKLDEHKVNIIQDAITAGLLGNLPAYVVEKDYHVTDALAALAAIPLSQEVTLIDKRQRDKRQEKMEIETTLVFAGGTCLSKGYRLIERMSEDIDIKVVLAPIPEGYRLVLGASSDKARLRALHAKVEQALIDAGFSLYLPERRDVVADGLAGSCRADENPKVMDERRYFLIELVYESHFTGHAGGALRTNVKVELIHRHPRLVTEELALTYLLEQRINLQNTDPFKMTCISIAETLAEKVLSLLRRCAWFWGDKQRGEFDGTLVRHIYDVWRIAEERPGAIENAAKVFSDAVLADVEEFGNQYDRFAKEPFEVLAEALNRARNDGGLLNDFNQRLTPLLLADHKPSYQVAFAAFESVVRDFYMHMGKEKLLTS